MHRIVLRAHKHADAEAESFGAGGGIREHLQGAITGVGPMVCSIVQPDSKPSSSARAR
jgi:hypothetical protein